MYNKIESFITGIWITSLILLFASFFVREIPENRTYTYNEGKIIANSWHDYYGLIVISIFIVISIMVVFFTILSIMNKIKYNTKIFKKILLIWITEFICSYIIFISYCTVVDILGESNYHPKFYEFSDDNNTIVIEEKSFLLMGKITVYQINNDNTAIIIGEFGTDDGGRNNGEYDMKWNDEYVEITYHTFNDSESKLTEKCYFVE